jgi:hypothetical protein
MAELAMTEILIYFLQLVNLNKMLMCLWKGCEFAVEDMAAFQEHVLTTHVQQPQQQQLILNDKQNDDGTEKEEMVEEQQIVAKFNHQEENKMIKMGGGQR